MVSITGRGTRWLAGGLLVSLAANVFFGGLVAGRIWGTNRRPAEVAATVQPSRGLQTAPQLNGPILRMVQSLPDEHRQGFVRALEPHRAILATAGQGARDARMKLGEATVADPFNRGAFLAASEQLDIRTQEQRKAYAAALADSMATLPTSVRRDLFDPQRAAGSGRRRAQ